MKIAVIGAGSWGSALTEVAARCGHDVLLWAFDDGLAEAIRTTRSNPLYLPAIQFSPNVQATDSLAEAANFCDTILMVTPSHHFRGILTKIKAERPSPIRVMSATKGIENDSLSRMSEITAAVMGDRLASFAVISGPTFALEVSRNDPTTAVVASADQEFASEMQHALSHKTFRLYRTDDVVGVELGGALKNVIAIAAGVVEGVGLGYNTMAALITRGLAEMKRLGIALGGKQETFAGLAGVGDLVLTCTGGLSRNRTVGVELGKGKTLAEILAASRTVAEGVKTSKSAKDLADRHGIEMPIVTEMYRLLYEGETPRNAIHRLMTRELKPES